MERNELDSQLTWDLRFLFESQTAFEAQLADAEKELKQLHEDIQAGDSILLKDTVDSSFVRFINDVLVVERIDDEGRIHGQFRMTQEYINLLPDLDVMVNLSRGNKIIKMIKENNERSIER